MAGLEQLVTFCNIFVFYTTSLRPIRVQIIEVFESNFGINIRAPVRSVEWWSGVDRYGVHLKNEVTPK